MKKIQPTITTNRYNSHDTWELINPVLAAGEIGIESDTKKFKFGDGITQWNSLSYASGEGGGSGGGGSFSPTVFEISYGETDITKMPTYSVAANPTTVIEVDVMGIKFNYGYGGAGYADGSYIISYVFTIRVEGPAQIIYLTLTYNDDYSAASIDWGNLTNPYYLQNPDTTLSESSNAPIANSTVTKALTAKQDQLTESQLSILDDTNLSNGYFIIGGGAGTTEFWLQTKSGDKLYVRPGTDITFTKNGDDDISINCDSDAIAAKVLAALPEYRGEVEYES